MKAFSAAGLQAAGVVRRPLNTGRLALLRTTGLSGAAAVLLALSPQIAHAADECGAPVNGVVTCQPGTHFPNGITYSIDPATPQDLTINLGDGQHVNTFGPHMGLVAGNLNGSVTVNGHTASIVTAGDGASGIFASTYLGDVTIDIGSVEVEGPRGGGIDVSTSGGDIDVKAGTVRAFADGSSGVNILSKAGNVRLDVGLVETIGYGGHGVHVEASGGAANISLGTVYTHGLIDAAGVYATASGDLTLAAGSVTTVGLNSSAIVAASYGGNVAVTAGTVSTRGDGSTGIYAVAGGDTPGAHVTIDVGSVSTHGTGHQSSGIVALNYSDGGAIDITVHDQVSTRLEGATGILAVSPTGAVTVNVKDVSTRGGRAEAVRAVGAAATVDVSGAVSTFGDGSSAVYALAWDGPATVNAAAVTTSGDGAAAITAIGVAGEVHVNAGTVTTSGAGSAGVQALAFYPADIAVNVQTVVASGDGSAGVVAHSYYGAAVVHAGTVTAGGMGIGASGHTGTVVTADSVVTSGDGGNGVIAGGGGQTIIALGSVKTSGNYASGVRAFGDHGTVEVTVSGAISTAGKNSWGVYASNHYGDDIVHTGGSIVTTGEYGVGVLANVRSGRAIIESASIATSGDRAFGIKVFGNGYGGREIHVTAGSITTTGANADGVHVENPDGGISQGLPTGLAPVTLPGGVGGLSGQVKAGGGDVGGGPGLFAEGPGLAEIPTNDITIATGTVKVSGAGANGLWVRGVGAVTVDAGATSAVSGKAIDVEARELGSVTVRGATTSEQGDAIALTGADALLTIAAGAKVSGVNGAVVNAVGPYVPPEDGGGGIGPFAAAAGAIGTATVVNAGTLAGTDYALQVNAGRAVVDNRGLIDGAVRLTGNDDVLTNAGQFAFAGDSDFGAGSDLFVNTGVVRVLPRATTAGAAAFLGLERFENTGGLVDLRNGHAGDVFTLSGDYVATGDARLGVDLGAGTADKLVIAGAASGKTTLLLGLTPAGAALTGSAPLTVVQAGAGSTGTFVLGNPDIGLIHYELTADADTAKAAAGPLSYSLKASAGTPVYATLALQDSARTAWDLAADAWSSHLAAMRGDAWAGGAATGRFWGQVYGSNADRSATAGGSVAVDYHQDDRGVQMGADLGRAGTGLGDVVWGVTGGYATTEIESRGGLARSELDTLDLGGYAAFTRGATFANALVKFDRHRISTSDQLAGYSVQLNGSSVGARFELGRRFGNDRLAIEPTAGLTWVRTSLDDVKVFGQTLAFDDAQGLTGRLGARVSGKHAFARGPVMVFYAGAAAVRNFSDDQGLTFTSGGTSQAVAFQSERTWGQGVLGVSARTGRGLTAFVEGDGDFGGGRNATGLRLGARFDF